jgi:hypothetical protein
MTALAADHKPASLQRKLTSITKAHQAAGFPSPATMQHAVVSETMKGIRRTLGTAQPGKEPLLTADIREMLDSLDDDLQGCRDRALLLAGFAGGFRRSELAALDVGDVSETEDGFVIRVRRSKTDPEGKGTSVALPYGSAGATCPVRSYLPRLDRQGSPHRGAGLPRRRPARAIHLTTSETRNMPEAVSQTFAPPSADDPLLATIRQLGDTFYTLRVTRKTCHVYPCRDFISSPTSPASSIRNCCGVRPASWTMPPIVSASTGSCLGMVTIRLPSVMTMCLPCLATWKPTFSSALTARR